MIMTMAVNRWYQLQTWDFMYSFAFKKRAASLSVFILTILVFLPALKNDFVNWDDDIYVYENTAIRAFDLKALAWMFTSYQGGNWHPLTWLSHGLDYALWGLNPFGHHLTSVVLHGLNAMLVFLVMVQLLLCARGLRGDVESHQAQAIPAV